MFGLRTPVKGSKSTQDSNSLIPAAPGENVEMLAGRSDSDSQKADNSLTKVRRSIGEWERGNKCSASNPPTTHILKPRGRVAEAKACLIKAKLQISSSRNLKAEIRSEVIQAVEKLYRLVKEAEEEKAPAPSTTDRAGKDKKDQAAILKTGDRSQELELAKQLEAHGKLLQENTERMAQFQQQQATKSVESGPATYATVAATSKPQPVHSMVVSSADVLDTSEDVITKIRTAVDARTTGIRVDRLRKAKEGKVVLGCQSKDELAKIAEKLRLAPTLQTEVKENKDPLVIIKNLLSVNTDEEVIAALRRQNGHILGDIPEEDYRATVRYRRRARNPHECHVVLRVSPRVWHSLTAAGRVHVDLQRVQVSDQSPLLQCTKCLGFGHGKKFCPEAEDLCSHCTEPHLRKDCPSWGKGEAPKCRNCTAAKLEKADHNAFDTECPVRQKWDRLARTNVAYC